MSATDFLDEVSLPPLIRTHTAHHLARLERAADLHALERA